MRLEIAFTTRAHDCKRETPTGCLDLHFLDRLLQRLRVVERTDGNSRESPEYISVKRGNAGLEIDCGNAILLALLDLEGHHEALALRVIFRQRGHHLHVGETVLQ